MSLTKKRSRLLCSGCFRSGKDLKGLKSLITNKKIFFNYEEFFEFGFLSCSENCAMLILSKSSYKSLINYANWFPHFANKWKRAQRLYDYFVEESLLEDDKKILDIAYNEILLQSRICPIKYEFADFLVLPMLFILLKDFQSALQLLMWFINLQGNTKNHSILLENKPNQFEHFVWILDIEKKYHTLTLLNNVKHQENWMKIVVLLLARIKLGVIEEIENLFVEKSDFFRNNRISGMFTLHQNIPDLLSVYFLGTSDRQLRRTLKKQENQLLDIIFLMSRLNCNCELSCLVQFKLCKNCTTSLNLVLEHCLLILGELWKILNLYIYCNLTDIEWLISVILVKMLKTKPGIYSYFLWLINIINFLLTLFYIWT